jgi:cysteine desulfurase
VGAYLDHAATTPLRPAAVEAMLPWLTGRFGNPSGAHAVARAARTAVEEAREDVAVALGCAPGEIVFTGSGTEADNLAVLGVPGPGEVVCSAVEHHAVLEPVAARGGRTVPVDAHGRVDLDALAATVGPRTTLVSVQLANNEVGTVQPLADVVRVVGERSPGAVVHSDAVQAAPWLDVADLASGADLVSVSGHKLGGPQGVGALVVRGGRRLVPLLRGGGQEAERRSGTHNVAGIVGLAAALREVVHTRTDTVARVGRLRDRLATGLAAAVPGLVSTGHPTERVAGSCSFVVEGVESEALLVLLDRAGVCASAASACASGAQQRSHVLAAMGVPDALAVGALRLSLGWASTDADVDTALEVVPAAVAQLRRAAA